MNTHTHIHFFSLSHTHSHIRTNSFILPLSPHSPPVCVSLLWTSNDIHRDSHSHRRRSIPTAAETPLSPLLSPHSLSLSLSLPILCPSQESGGRSIPLHENVNDIITHTLTYRTFTQHTETQTQTHSHSHTHTHSPTHPLTHTHTHSLTVPCECVE